MANQQKLTKGTIYLQGTQSRFHESIIKALNIEPTDPQLTYAISTDLIRSKQTGDLMYRIDYIYHARFESPEGIGPSVVERPARNGRFEWLYWLWAFWSEYS